MTAAPHPRERLRTAVGRILDVFVDRQGSEAEFETWAGIAERYAARIEALPPETVFWGLGTRGVLSVTGLPSTTGIRPTVADQGDRVEAVVNFGPEHQGHPGLVHGGVIAAAFDEIFGLFQTFSQPRVVTAELTIRYLVPVPVGETVRFDAEIYERDGRKLRVRGNATINGATHASAEALFIITREPGAE